jgi:Flp pilus assembly protein TadG
MIARSTLARNCVGAAGAEFAMVLPLLVILLFGIIDGGRFIWEYNRAEKATQVGTRMAVVTDIVSTGLRDNDYVGVDGLTAGQRIPASSLGTIVCNDTGCTCTGACTGVGAGYDGVAFANLVDRMNDIKPDITAANVEVVYRGSGLGYAGDPTGMSISPLVTVRLEGLQFQPITSLMLATISMPAFTTTLTAEDSVGSFSN